jgi:hypothetical protein
MNGDSCGGQDGDDSGAVSGLSSEETAQCRSTGLLAGRLAEARAAGICLGAGPLENDRVPALSSEAFVDWVFALTLTLASDVADQHL